MFAYAALLSSHLAPDSACSHCGPDGPPSWFNHRPVCGVYQQGAAHSCGGVVHLQEHQTVRSIFLKMKMPLDLLFKQLSLNDLTWSILFRICYYFLFICSHLVVPMIRLCGNLLPPTPQRSPWSHTLMKRATWRARSCSVILKAHWQCVALPPTKWLSLAGKSNWCPMVRTHWYQNPQRSLLAFSLSFELKFDGVSTFDI